MCEYNQTYSPSHGHCMDGPNFSYPVNNKIVVLPQSAWQKRLAEMPEAEAETITNAEREAGELGSDVHVYRKVGSTFIGIAFLPGDGPTVKIWEH